ncbi:hypothetical protein ACLOJK_031003 [Asimina triloba]
MIPLPLRGTASANKEFGMRVGKRQYKGQWRRGEASSIEEKKQLLQTENSTTMKTVLASEMMDIPEGVKVKVKAKMIELDSPRGKLTRNFKHLNLDFQLIEGGKQLKVDAWFGYRKTMLC